MTSQSEQSSLIQAIPKDSPIVKPGDAYSVITKSTFDFFTIQDGLDELDELYQDTFELVVDQLNRFLEISLNLAHSAYLLDVASMEGDYEDLVEDDRLANRNGSSTSSDPYFTHGDALFLQDDLHGAQEVYGIGVESVPKGSPEYDLLVERHNGVAAMISESEGYLNALPLMAITPLLVWLSIKDLLELAMTCKYWNNLVLHQWPHTWRSVSSKMPVAIEKVRPEQVKDVYMEFTVDTSGTQDPECTRTANNWELALIDDISLHRRNQWGSIESMTLKYVPAMQFERLTELNLKNLRKLTFYGIPNQFNYCIPMLLDAARSFESLQEMTCEITEEYVDITTSTMRFLEYLSSYATLEDFHITSLWISANLEPDMLMDIFEMVPELTSLMLNSAHFKDSDVLETLFEKCWNLREFQYIHIKDIPPMTLRITYTRQPSKPLDKDTELINLKTMVFRPELSDFDEEYRDKIDANNSVLCVLECSLTALVTLDLNLDLLENGRYSGLNILDYHKAPKLRTLILRASEECTVDPYELWQFLMKCPSLVTVHAPALWHEAIIHGLPIGTIKRLYLAYDKTTKPNPKGELMGVMQEFFANASHLTELSVTSTSITPLRREVITFLCRAIRHSSVRSLDLHTTTLPRHKTLAAFVKQLERTRVETLKIRVECEIGETELASFAKMQHLRHLIVYNDDGRFGVDQLCRLLDIWKQPQMLMVHIRCEKEKQVISGYKTSIRETRQLDDMIEDPKIRYTVTQSTLDTSDDNNNEWCTI